MQRRNREKRPVLIYLVIILTASVIFALDFIIKSYFRLNYPFQSIPIIKNIFHISVVFNRGAAFGILQGKNALLILFSIILICLFIFFVKNNKKSNLITAISYGLILGGALSNLYDRLFLGYVVDYLDFRIWPVFNLSDTCISVGIAIILWHFWQEEKNNAKNNKSLPVR